MAKCCIVNAQNQQVRNALVIIDGEALQLSQDCFEIELGKHHIKVMHKDYLTEEGTLNITKPFNIMLGGEPSLLR